MKVFLKNVSIDNVLSVTHFILKLYICMLDTAEHIWKSVTSVSNAGKKRGRGKGVGKKRAKNLNRGQIIGVGKYLITIVIVLYYIKSQFV